MFSALITLQDTMGAVYVEPIQSCIPFKVPHGAPAAVGSLLPLSCISYLLLAFHVCVLHLQLPALLQQASTIVVCSKTVFWCAISLASSINFNFFLVLLTSRVLSVIFYKSPKSFLYKLSNDPSYIVFFSPSSCSPRHLAANCVFLHMCTFCIVLAIQVYTSYQIKT